MTGKLSGTDTRKKCKRNKADNKHNKLPQTPPNKKTNTNPTDTVKERCKSQKMSWLHVFIMNLMNCQKPDTYQSDSKVLLFNTNTTRWLMFRSQNAECELGVLYGTTRHHPDGKTAHAVRLLWKLGQEQCLAKKGSKNSLH